MVSLKKIATKANKTLLKSDATAASRTVYFLKFTLIFENFLPS